jgi:uncharacterized protein (DUF736 family)
MFHGRKLSFVASALLAAGSLVSAPIGESQSASAESIVSQVGSDIDGESENDRSGLSVSLSSDGTRAAIGAYDNDGNGSNAGHVRVYDWNGTAWVQAGSDIDGEAANDRSGHSVSLSSDGTRVAIGAYGNDGNGSSAGHVRVYDWNGTAWVQAGSDIDGESENDRSGYSVSLSSDGTRVAIGAYHNDGNGSYAGHVRVYDWNGTAWVQVGSDIDSEAAGDQSGISVSLSSDGTRVAIGAFYNDGNGSYAGHVRVYDWNGTAWVQAGSDIDGEAAYDSSGHSVSLSSDGTRVAIGANGNDGGGDGSGHVRIYDWTDGAWVQFGSDIDGEAAYDYSGVSVSLSSDGTRVAIGAYGNDGNGSSAGHVRIYSMSTATPANPANPAPYSGPLPTNYSDGTPSIGDDMTISGLRLDRVTSCTIDGIDVQISNHSADSFTIVIPAGLEPGLKDLVIFGTSGKLTAQGAFTVEASPIESSAVTEKTNAGSFNGYVAVYAKGHKGKTLSWKIAGKWFKTTITSDYQVFQRKTAAVGLDVDVHLYIDGQKQLTKTVRTR